MSEKKILVGIDLGPAPNRFQPMPFGWQRLQRQRNLPSSRDRLWLDPPTYVIPYLEVEKARLDADLKTWTEKLNTLGMSAEGKLAVVSPLPSGS